MLFLLLLAAATFSLPHVDATAGVAALDLDTGRAVRIRADERFPMGSVYKLPIGITLLHAVDRGSVSLDREITIEPAEFAPGYSPIRDAANGKPVTLTVAKLLDAMLSDSDNTASDALLRLLGGGAKVTARMRALGITAVRIDRTEKEIAADIGAHGVAAYNADRRDTATPGAMIGLLRKLYRHEEGLTPASHALLLKILTESRNPRRMVNGLPPGVTLAHKSGQMPGVLNDVGLVTSPDGHHHLAIVIFTKSATVDAAEPRIESVAAIARRVYEELTR